MVQDCVVEGETDECIDSETDVNEDFFETELDESRQCFLVMLFFFTVSKTSLKALCSSVKCFAFFICKAEGKNGEQVTR